jgi:hypothetical protein
MMTKRIKNTVESLSGLPKVSVIYNETNILLRYNKCFDHQVVNGCLTQIDYSVLL